MRAGARGDLADHTLAGPWDVVIAGLGPVGSALAGLLGKRGLRVLGVDRELDVFPLPRAGHIDHTALRTIQEIGCLDEILPHMVPNRGLDLLTANHELLARLPGQQATPSGLPASMLFHQPTVDRALRQSASFMASVELITGSQIVGLEPGDEGVSVRVARGPATSCLTSSIVVGCDGASSFVRKTLGLEMQDFGFNADWLVVDLLLHTKLETLPSNITQVCDPKRPYVAVPMTGLRYRFEFMLLPSERAEEVTRPAVLERLLAPWLSAELFEVERAAVYRFTAATAQRWRKGRVMLAGDAAHQMPPFLGQGMCSGIRDAANLAWKLEHVLRHRAPLELLDTYETERKPHVNNVTQTATRLGRALCLLDPAAAAARDRKMLSDPTAPDERLSFKLGELSQGPLVLSGGGTFFPQPAGGRARFDDVVGQRFLVLARHTDQLSTAATWWSQQLGAMVTTLDQLGAARQALAAWMDTRDFDVVVVRPDRYVLGAGKDLASITDAVRSLLAKDSSP